MIDWFWSNMEKGFILWHPEQHEPLEWPVPPNTGNPLGAIHNAPQTWDDGRRQNLYIRFERFADVAPEIRDVIVYGDVIIAAGATRSIDGSNKARGSPRAPMSKRQSLLLLSGLICDETIWQDIAPRLAGVADLRMHSFPGFDSISAMAKHVLQTAPEHFALAGHSMGGRVALEIMRTAPSRVLRLALLNTGARAAPESEAQTRRRLVAIAREQGMTALAPQWLPPMMGAPRARIDAVTPRLTRMVERSTPESFAAQVTALLERPDALDVLPTIRVPTLLLSGAEDNWSPLAQHAEMHRLIPRSMLVAIPDAGHMAPVEQPAAVATALLTWLALG